MNNMNNMNNMNRQAILCDQLDLNFQEANELFGEESLESMQMARVNGGFVVSGTAVAIATILGAIASVVSCVYVITSEKEVNKDGPTEATQSITILTNLVEKMVIDGKGGTIKCDSIVGNKIYGLEFTIGVATPGQ